MPETYCGKSCSACERKDGGLCGGCGSFDCAVLLCCRKRGIESCGRCVLNGCCDRQDRAMNAAREAEQRRELGERLGGRAGPLGSWLGILFFMLVLNVVLAVFYSIDSYSQREKDVVQAIFALCYTVVLFCLGRLERRYAAAGALRLAAIALQLWCLYGPGVDSSVWLYVVSALPAAAAMGFELAGHVRVCAPADERLARSWRNLAPFCLLIPFITAAAAAGAAVGLMLVVLLCLCVFYVLYMVLMHRTYRMFNAIAAAGSPGYARRPAYRRR